MRRWMNSIDCIGDSLTHAVTLMIPSEKLWPAVLQSNLEAAGKSVVVRNWGKSGNTTAQMITRFQAMTQFGVPKIGIIWGGTNDPSNSINASGTQANLQTMIASLKLSGCNNVIIIGQHLLNYASGGDISGGVPVLDSACTYAAIIAAQKAASIAGGAEYCDLYNYLRARIIAGTDVAGSYSWHVATGDIHMNAYGATLVANAVLETIASKHWDDIL